MKKFIVFFVVACQIQSLLQAQALAFTDPAQGFNKLMLDKQGDGGAFDRVGAYKVKGTPLLFGGKFPGAIYLSDNYYKDIFIKYNTFSQELTAYDKDDKALATKKTSEVDSFYIDVKTMNFTGNIQFISAYTLGTKENFFLQKITPKKKYTLYKRYKGDLAIVNENILQSDLRQYDLLIEFYYTEEGVPGLKKIKLTTNAITKEFKKIKDISGITDDEFFSYNYEVGLISIFKELNNL